MRFQTGLLGPAIRRILEYAAAHGFVLVSTESDFEGLHKADPGGRVVILRSCDYSTDVAANALRRNAIRIAELAGSQNSLIFIDR